MDCCTSDGTSHMAYTADIVTQQENLAAVLKHQAVLDVAHVVRCKCRDFVNTCMYPWKMAGVAKPKRVTGTGRASWCKPMSMHAALKI